MPKNRTSVRPALTKMAEISAARHGPSKGEGAVDMSCFTVLHSPKNRTSFRQRRTSFCQNRTSLPKTCRKTLILQANPELKLYIKTSKTYLLKR